MQKIKVGIVGFGNIGKQLKKRIETNDKFDLIAIFSRRKIEGCLPYENIEDYKNKIDIMFLCVGSQTDLEQVAFSLAKNFNTIDCYDNHNRLKQYVEKRAEIAKQNHKVCLCALGWDPGIFSLMRAMFGSLSVNYHTFWGKGLSQGHTQAVKRIKNVKDALQFTLPNKKALKMVEHGEELANNVKLHKRLCYVVCEVQFEQQIKQQIRNMPDYFVGYETTVKFVSQQQLDELKSFAHKGVVVAPNKEMKFELNLNSNPEFTARVLLAFAPAAMYLYKQQNYGAYTILDLPLSLVIDKEKFHYI